MVFGLETLPHASRRCLAARPVRVTGAPRATPFQVATTRMALQPDGRWVGVMLATIRSNSTQVALEWVLEPPGSGIDCYGRRLARCARQRRRKRQLGCLDTTAVKGPRLLPVNSTERVLKHVEQSVYYGASARHTQPASHPVSTPPGPTFELCTDTSPRPRDRQPTPARRTSLA